MNTIEKSVAIPKEKLPKYDIWVRINLTMGMVLLIAGVIVSIVNPLMGIRAITFGLYTVYDNSEKIKKIKNVQPPPQD